jgi:hypothetical protein
MSCLSDAGAAETDSFHEVPVETNCDAAADRTTSEMSTHFHAPQARGSHEKYEFREKSCKYRTVMYPVAAGESFSIPALATPLWFG